MVRRTNDLDIRFRALQNGPMAKYDEFYRDDAAACGAPFSEVVRFFEALPRDPPLRVLDAGCGQGRDALVAARAGHHVRCFDVSQVGIDQLRTVAKRERLVVDASVASLEDYREEDRFDVVIADRVLHCIPDAAGRKRVFKRLADAVVPGGHLFVIEPKNNAKALVATLAAQHWWRHDLKKPGYILAQRLAT